MIYTVCQSRPGRPVRELYAGDEAVARIVYFVARTSARKGTFTELRAGDETVDADVSSRAHGFKTTSARRARSRGEQLGLFA